MTYTAYGKVDVRKALRRIFQPALTVSHTENQPKGKNRLLTGYGIEQIRNREIGLALN